MSDFFGKSGVPIHGSMAYHCLQNGEIEITYYDAVMGEHLPTQLT